jgi:hypothetical protein
MDEPVKRKPGNPNWVKKNPENAATTPEKPKNDTQVWLTLFSAILTGHQNLGPSLIKNAADNADIALAEYNKRFHLK